MLYVETQNDKFNVNIENNEFRNDILTQDENNLIISKLKNIDSAEQQKIAENIIKKLEGKTILMPADVFVKSGLIGDVSMIIDEDDTILDSATEIFDIKKLENLV